MGADGTNARRSGSSLPPRKVLYSLEMASLGHSGIPQESRLLAKMFMQDTPHDVTGLLMEARDQMTAHIRGGATKDPADEVLAASNYLLGLSGFESPGAQWRHQRYKRTLWHLYRTYWRASRGYSLTSIPAGLFEDTVWRRLFAATLPPEAKAAMDRLPLVYSPMTITDLHRSRGAPHAPRPKLDTTGYDAVIFHDARPIRVNPTTAKFIRYHDAIPISEPDLMGEGYYTSVHHNFIKRCRDDSWFICNSDATRKSLVKIFPDLEAASIVIPNVINPALDSMARTLDPWDVVSRRQSIPDKVKQPVLTVPAEARSAGYILAVTTLEPKKNVAGLVAAWERVREMHRGAPKLVIVGGKGWNFDNDLRALYPHVVAGDAFHLENVPYPELQALYVNAAATCFPSFAEGFGYPPMEALVAGTPSVVSDLPALRETMGQAAIYVDPYSPDSIARGLLALIEPGNGSQRADLMKHRQAQIERHSPARVAGLWADLIGTTPPRTPDVAVEPVGLEAIMARA